MREMDDIELMLKVKEDDLDAFKSLYERYKKQMVKYAYRFLANFNTAEEIAQETLLHVYSARRDYNPTAKFSTWIYRICTNLCLNELRKHEYSVKIKSIDEEREDNKQKKIELEDNENPDQYEVLVEKELRAIVQKYLNQLPERQKSAFILKNFEGQSYEEIAKVIGTSVKGVKSLLNRARSTMCEKLKKTGVLNELQKNPR